MKLTRELGKLLEEKFDFISAKPLAVFVRSCTGLDENAADSYCAYGYDEDVPWELATVMLDDMPDASLMKAGTRYACSADMLFDTAPMSMEYKRQNAIAGTWFKVNSK